MQQVVGLPCPFCGGTRAMHCLLEGHWQRALYFNWIAFPALLAVVIWTSIAICELIRKRRILPPIKLTPRTGLFFILGLAAIWFWHVYQALATPKPELLNSKGLFFQFVSFPEKRYIPGSREQDAASTRISSHTKNTAN